MIRNVIFPTPPYIKYRFDTIIRKTREREYDELQEELFKFISEIQGKKQSRIGRTSFRQRNSKTIRERTKKSRSRTSRAY